MPKLKIILMDSVGLKGRRNRICGLNLVGNAHPTRKNLCNIEVFLCRAAHRGCLVKVGTVAVLILEFFLEQSHKLGVLHIAILDESSKLKV
jgi:hypothetical protein